jgi:hypothetical protein
VLRHGVGDTSVVFLRSEDNIIILTLAQDICRVVTILLAILFASSSLLVLFPLRADLLVCGLLISLLLVRDFLQPVELFSVELV